MNTNRNNVLRIKEQYPPGTRIKLISMSDPYAPVPPGTEGVVTAVDDIGTLHMNWSNGRTLGVIPGEDHFSVISCEQQQTEEGFQMGGMKFE